MNSSWAKLPQELKALKQWCYTLPSDPDPKRRKAPRKAGNWLASDTNPNDWMTFDQACYHATQVGGEIGFILTAEDPFTCIDMDVTDAQSQAEKGEPNTPELWTTKVQLDRYWHICQMMASYTELSRSGKGLHVWVLGAIGRGCKRDGVEIYSQERFIICTGKTVIDVPMQDQQSILDIMVGEMRTQQMRERKVLVEVEEELEDWDLMDRAINADNSDKFNQLCKLRSNCDHTGEPGDWHIMGYKSQSEADLALMSIFTFYSPSNEQCRRLFRMTGLGQREKSQKDNRYLDFTLELIRGRQASQEAVDAESIERAAHLVMQLEDEARRAEAAKYQGLMHVPSPNGLSPEVAQAPITAMVASTAPRVVNTGYEDPNGLEWPPGLTGVIAQFVFRNSMRPVKEVAIVTALGFLAGVCGKAFGIPQSGLNMYITLIARSGVGKEAMHSGMAALVQAVASRQPPAARFVDFSKFASGQALTKAVLANPSFVNVFGEWGRKLEQMAADNGRNENIQGLRTVMTDLYQKSGAGSIVGGVQYSNKEGNLASVNGVAYSMIGESTPDTFYKSLTQSMMEDGFLSRFLTIEYAGIRPPLNDYPEMEPSKVLGDGLAELCTHAMSVMDRGERIMVNRTDGAAHMLRNFGLECDDEINGSEDESYRQMWNRAALKVMRLAALMAAADNWLTPCVNEEHVAWALKAIRNDIRIMSDRMNAGDVGGADDANRTKKLQLIIREYMGIQKGQGINMALRTKGIVNRRYLQLKTSKLRQFTTHRGGANAALDSTLRTLMDDGYISELDRGVLQRDYSYHGRAFRIIDNGI